LDRKQNSEEEQLNPGHIRKRNLLRRIGPVVLGLGVLLLAVGTIDFFISMSSFGRMPTLFWCNFLGMPMIFFGVVMTKIGYVGSIARYMSAENSPVAKDTFNYMADGAREGVRDIASAIREGVTGDVSGSACCPGCKQPNDRDAKFCDACGGSVSYEKDCPDCEVPNDHDAKFCDGCGSPFQTA